MESHDVDEGSVQSRGSESSEESDDDFAYIMDTNLPFSLRKRRRRCEIFEKFINPQDLPPELFKPTDDEGRSFYPEDINNLDHNYQLGLFEVKKRIFYRELMFSKYDLDDERNVIHRDFDETRLVQHFVLGVFDIDKRHIDVYDSLKNSKKTKNLVKHIKDYCSLIPKLLEVIDFVKFRPTFTDFKDMMYSFAKCPKQGS
ncbi:hypothetical protein RND71_030149 [Anisodus tanguticus]|uniref:Uncharacterized protein n=1 Tax=Anisodus tanguticus TaxID=243964 RepID=A0AAE1RFH4_9SOLA|nr:hypothetical protein RND71_030149 [Anisodus tanguticus]